MKYILSTETSPMSHVTATAMRGPHSYWTGRDPKTKYLMCLWTKYKSSLKLLSTETSPMSHVTATVRGGSHSYLTGTDPKAQKRCNTKFILNSVFD